MAKKGYIEGFYGKLMKPKDRELLLNTLSDLRMNFYVYGPKEDKFHRNNWEDLYPDLILQELSTLKSFASEKGIRFYMALSPNIGMDRTRGLKLKKLEMKISQFLDVGVEDFAIFFDDIDNERDKKLAENHLEILELVESLVQPKKDSLMFCPTVYCNNFANYSFKDSYYLQTLSKGDLSNWIMLWTGQEVISKSISDSDIKPLKDLFKNKIYIWDNYYANDYCPSKVFLGSYKGRKKLTSIDGIGLNPTGFPNIDSFILNRFNNLSNKEILEKFEVPKDFKKILPFFEGPFETPIKFSLKDLKETRKITSQLVLDWKSDLQVELAPYLWNLTIDLSLLIKIKENKSKLNDYKKVKEWISRRYPVVLAEIIRDIDRW